MKTQPITLDQLAECFELGFDDPENSLVFMLGSGKVLLESKEDYQAARSEAMLAAAGPKKEYRFFYQPESESEIEFEVTATPKGDITQVLMNSRFDNRFYTIIIGQNTFEIIPTMAARDASSEVRA